MVNSGSCAMRSTSAGRGGAHGRGEFAQAVGVVAAFFRAGGGAFEDLRALDGLRVRSVMPAVYFFSNSCCQLANVSCQPSTVNSCGPTSRKRQAARQRSFSTNSIGVSCQTLSPTARHLSAAAMMSCPSLNRSASTNSSSPTTRLTGIRPASTKGWMFSMTTVGRRWTFMGMTKRSGFARREDAQGGRAGQGFPAAKRGASRAAAAFTSEASGRGASVSPPARTARGNRRRCGGGPASPRLLVSVRHRPLGAWLRWIAPL